MEEGRKVLVASFEHVVVWRLGEEGYDDFFPGTVSLYTMPDNNYKVWIIARGQNSNLTLNAILPQNVALVQFKNEKRVITVGKMPSTTYVDERNNNKLIPTLWKLEMACVEDKERLLFALEAG